MFGLSFGKNKFVGIDIGTSAIKAVELRLAGGKPILSNYAWMPLGQLAGVESDNMEGFDEIVSQYLKLIFKEAGFKTKNVNVSIPAFGGLITLIEFPEMAKADMEQAIRFEAQKYIPTSLDEVVLSWDILEKTGAESIDSKGMVSSATISSTLGKVCVLLVAASKAKVEKYENIINAAGLKLFSMEIENFSMARALVGNDPGNFIIVDIGSRVCNIILVEKGAIKVNRNIDAGGKDITRSISKSVGLDELAAERLKLSGKNFFARESFVALPTLDLVCEEIRRMIESYYKGKDQSKINSIILSGGTTNLVGVSEYLTESLKLKVIRGNPFGRITVDKKLEPILEKIGPQFSVCVGLALKGLEKNLK